jgi:hypothetical protein
LSLDIGFRLNPHFSLRPWKGGALQAAEKPYNAVILSGAKDPALSIFEAMRDSSSPLLLRMTAHSSFSASSLAPPLQGRPDYFQVPHTEPLRQMAEGICGNPATRERFQHIFIE